MKSSLPIPSADGPRIAIVGTSGAGKTSLARRLSGRLGIPHVELDAIHWRPDWEPTEEVPFREAVREATSAHSWVTDGNYEVVREIIWERATHLIWLDYPLRIVFPRLLGRTLRRGFRQEELYGGNRESLRTAFFDRESVLLWALQSHPRYRREYPEWLSRYATQRTVLRLKRPKEAERLVESLEGLRTSPQD